MKFTIQDASTLDPAALADELIAALGSHYGISTAGREITTQTEPDAISFQAVLDAHVANAANRVFNKCIEKQITDLEATQSHRRIREAITPAGVAWLESLNAQIAALRSQLK